MYRRRALDRIGGLARQLQPTEGIGYFLRRAQIIRPVQLIYFHPLDAETLEGLLARPDNVAGGKIVPVRGIRLRIPRLANAALGRDHHALAHLA